MLSEIREELQALASRREELLKQSVGKVFLRTMYHEDICLGEGYDVLENFCERWFHGNITKEKILHNIELSVFNACFQPDSDQTTCNIIIDLGDQRIEIIERIESIPFVMPKLPDIVMLPNPLKEKHKEPVPPYRSKLHAYEKRRNYSKKSNWKRIRSRLF